MLLRDKVVYQSAHRLHRFSRRATNKYQAAASASQPPRRSAFFVSPVWPEPSSSAAGVRTACLIDALLSANWTVSYLSYSKPNQHTSALSEKGCSVIHCPPNREALFADAIAASKPSICIFDRFIAEEAFSFRVRELAPDALRVLDLQDLHSLRRGREAKFRQDGRWWEVADFHPGQTDDTLRELASIHRSDLSLVCSPVEVALLKDVYGVAAAKLQLAPFFVDCRATQATSGGAGFTERRHFITIGNFRHTPNLDSVKWLSQELWPKIRELCPPDTQLHNYGAYGTSQEVQRLHCPEEGFHIKGHAESLEVMRGYRALLAPLRFGAGLKGKVVDAWSHCLPVCTTAVGAEGMHLPGEEAGWGGLMTADTPLKFAEDAAKLYNDQALWESSVTAGLHLLKELYDDQLTMPPVINRMEHAVNRLQQLREADMVGAVLWRDQSRATEYFSRWIELKESLAIAP